MLLIYFFLHFYLLFFWIFHQKYHNHPQSTVILLGQVIYRSLNCFFLSFIFHNLSSTICKKQNPPRQNHSVSPGRVYHTLIFPCFAGLVHLHATILLSGIFDSSLGGCQNYRAFATVICRFFNTLYLQRTACNGVQREHNKKLNNGLPILHKVPPK